MFESCTLPSRRLAASISAVLATVALAACVAGPAGADPATSVDIGDVASASWSGVSLGTTSNNFGGNSAANIGDVNDDGIDDVAVMVEGGIAVLFTPPSGHNGGVTTSEMPPNRGYIVDAAAGGGVFSVAGIGDQNGDGVPDIAFGQTNIGVVNVVYGISDPSGLPTCVTGSSRCLDTATMALSDGYVLTSSAPAQFGSSLAGLGDFKGTQGANDFAIGDSFAGNGGEVYVVSGSFDPVSSPVDVTTAAPSDVLKIVGSQTGATLGTSIGSIGDVNEDGISDMYALESAFAGSNPGLGYVIYGSGSFANPLDLSTFSNSMGFTLSPPVLSVKTAGNAGDVNGDGRPDLAVGGFGLTGPSGSGAVIYGPDSPPVAPISMTTPTAAQGYAIQPGDANGRFGIPLANAGDINGDGIPDQLFSGTATEINGNSGAGVVDLVFGKRPTPASPLLLGPDLVPENGMAIVSQGAGDALGAGLVPLGDIDKDGLPDYLLASGVAGIGSVKGAFLVLGSSLVAQANTGSAVGIVDKSATLTGAASGTRGTGSAKFEYGTTTDYGQTSSAQEIDSTSSVAAAITDLAPTTTYHYRVVVTDSLGVASYGEDKTFTTTATPSCVDPNGCAPKTAKLSKLVVSPTKYKTKRGKSSTITAILTSTGTAAAQSVKICVKAPKKSIGVKQCQNIGSMEPGQTAEKKFKVKAKKKTKGAKLAFTATSSNVSKKTASAKVVVK